MSPAALVPIEVEVAFPAGEAPAIGHALFESRVRARASDLIEDLAIPATPRIKVGGSVDDLVGTSPVVVLIGGTSCRQEFSPLREADFGDLGALVNFVSSVLYANRQLFLTGPLLRELATSHSEGAVALLPEMVRRGCSLAVAGEVAKERTSTADEESLRYQMELAIARRFPTIVTLEAGRRLFEQLTDHGSSFRRAVLSMRERLFHDLGVKFPDAQVTRSATLDDREWRARIGMVRGPVTSTLGPEQRLVGETPETLRALDVQGQVAHNPEDGSLCTVVEGAKDVALCEARFPTWDSQQYVLLRLAGLLRGSADAFLTVNQVQRTVHLLSEAFPLPIVDLLERFSPTHIAGVMRALVREGFSIRDLRSVFEAMLETNGRLPVCPRGSVVIAPPVARLAQSWGEHSMARSPEDCADHVRTAMKRYLTHARMRSGELHVVETTSETEVRLRGMPVEIPQPEQQALIRSVGRVLQDVKEAEPVSILTASDVRRRLRESLALEFPHLRVLCREEIQPSSAIRTRGHISWERGSV
jgi:flagellar biosynthesis component FlhA